MYPSSFRLYKRSLSFILQNGDGDKRTAGIDSKSRGFLLAESGSCSIVSWKFDVIVVFQL